MSILSLKEGILCMKLAYRLILTLALLVTFFEYSHAVSASGSYSSYTLLYSSNVAGETEPCG